jgi:hypothetical protein
MSTGRGLTQRVLLAALGVLVGVLLCELGARLLFTDFYRCDETLGWGFVPGRSGQRLGRGFEYLTRAHINALGLRDVERTLAKPAGVYRIVVLGDSMVAGLQVAQEETFSARLETALAAEMPPGGARVEVWNAGVDGYGTAQQLLLLDERLAAAAPDLVLATVFLRNDVADNWPAAGARNHGLALRCGRPFLDPTRAAGDLAPVPHAQPGLRLALALRSRLAALLLPPAVANPPAFRPRALYATPWSDDVEGAWRRTLALLRALVARAGERPPGRGAAPEPAVAVVMLPDAFQATLRAPRRAALAADGRDPDRPFALLEAALARDAVAHLDLRRVFQALPVEQARAAFLPLDGHWSRQGHELAADAILAWLRRECGALRLPPAWCSAQKARGPEAAGEGGS